MAPDESTVVLRVLFVCIGNSCRSPMAESVLKSMVDERWEVDSAALANWNVGRNPEPRCIKMLATNGLTSNHKGRQIEVGDFVKFDYIFGMDYKNMEDLNEMAVAGCTAKIEMLGTYDLDRPDVIVDPYFESGMAGFERAYQQIVRSCRNFVDLQAHRFTSTNTEL